MTLARFSRITVTLVAAGLLVAYATKRENRTVDPVGGVGLPREQQRAASRETRLAALPTQIAIAPEDAANCVGQTRTVCGTVVSSRYLARGKGWPTFLNLDRSYPNQVFTVVIWGRDRGKFPDSPEAYYRDRKICVTGRIVAYRGRAQIVVTAPAQIVIPAVAETMPITGR